MKLSAVKDCMFIDITNKLRYPYTTRTYRKIYKNKFSNIQHAKFSLYFSRFFIGSFYSLYYILFIISYRFLIFNVHVLYILEIYILRKTKYSDGILHALHIFEVGFIHNTFGQAHQPNISQTYGILLLN